MAPVKHFTHRFGEFLPNELDEGVLYVSMAYSVVLHLCACGCRTKVVCALRPHGYAMAFDGQSISIWPSIGNWSFYCQSHYVVQRSKVHWVPASGYSQVTTRRLGAKRAKNARAKRSGLALAHDLVQPKLSQACSAPTCSFWESVIEKIFMSVRSASRQTDLSIGRGHKMARHPNVTHTVYYCTQRNNGLLARLATFAFTGRGSRFGR